MERSLFRFILKYSKREQLMIVPLVVASMVVYFMSLDLPKTIINQAIQGKAFPEPTSTAHLLRYEFRLPDFLGGDMLRLFSGFELERLPYLIALSLGLLFMIALNGFLKLQINTMKGWMGERMLRRLRYVLFDHILRFPLARFRRVKPAEMSSMIKDEVEPLGGFIGESMITPLFLAGEALTALFFIMYQHFLLGTVALAVISVQAFVIPKLRRRLLQLAKERQLTARQLAGRIAETVDGIVEIHTHDTSNYERAEISARLGKIFRIRFEFYQRKFMIKFLNNFLSQVTPFIFYLMGGYLVINGRLDIGALVAVIAAYKDLPSPIKELIDWDQQRMDVQIKYNQVSEQFTVDNLAPPESQVLMESPALPKEGSVIASNLTLADETGNKSLDGVSFDIPLDRHVALVGPHACGSSELLQLLARLAQPTSGTLRVGGIDLGRAPEAMTGRALAYVGSTGYLFPRSVLENVTYGLNHYPVAPAVYEGAARREHDIYLKETQRAANSLLDVNAQWLDYAGAGASGATELEAKIAEVLKVVELDEKIFELGLRSSVSGPLAAEIMEPVLHAREAMRERLGALGIHEWVEHFDPERYNRNATLAENLLFGTPVGKIFDVDNLARNSYVRRVLKEIRLEDDLLKMGHKIAETMVELFSGLPPGHEFFERFSFIRLEDLPTFQEILASVVESGLQGLNEEAREQLLALPFKLVNARHRLGLVDDTFEDRILQARRYFAEHLPADMKKGVEFFDPARFNSAASLQDNVLFGKIVSGQAEAPAKIGTLLREVLDELGLRHLIVKIGMDYQVGVGGARLATQERQKIALARALLKRPAVLVMDQSVAVLDPAAQRRIMKNILDYRPSASVYWAINREDLVDLFHHAVVMEAGRIVESGPVAELKSKGGALAKMLATT